MRAGAVRILILKIIRVAESFFLLLFFYISQNASATRRPKWPQNVVCTFNTNLTMSVRLGKRERERSL